MIENNQDITQKIYYRYAIDCVTGKQVCCEYVKKACQRFLNDLQRPNFLFRPEMVQRVAKFIYQLKHFKGKSAGRNFRLEPWQSFITANVFGFYREVTDELTGEKDLIRRFDNVYIEMSRKQGKSALVAAYALYCLIYDFEPSSEVVLSANSKEQAGIIYDLVQGFAKSIDPKEKRLHILRNGIEVKNTLSVLKVVAADTSKLDGLSGHCCVLDERHESKDNKMYQVLRSSMGFRKQPIMISITTAGFHKEYPCYTARQTIINILNNMVQEDNTFGIIYTLDEGDDWKDPKNFIKCSPNLGITTTTDYMNKQVKSAINDPTNEVGVKTKILNLWCDVAETWISSDIIRKRMLNDDGTQYKLDLNDYRESIAFVGVDLSSVNDLTSFSLLLYNPDEGVFRFKNYSYLPEETIKNHPNREYYQQMVRLGFLTLTPGNVVDYDYMINDLMKIQQEYDIALNLFIDPYASTYFINKCYELGLVTFKFSQSFLNISPPTKELHRQILKGTIQIECNLMVLWQFGNAVIKEDNNSNQKVVKTSNNNKIDNIICMIEALGGCLKEYNITPVIESLDK